MVSCQRLPHGPHSWILNRSALSNPVDAVLVAKDSQELVSGMALCHSMAFCHMVKARETAFICSAAPRSASSSRKMACKHSHCAMCEHVLHFICTA